MIRYPLGINGPLNRETAELGLQRPRLPLGGTSGGYDGSGINPGGMYTGGTTRPSGSVTTGGPLPPSTVPAVHTGGPGQVFPGTPTGVQTGGGLPPSTSPVPRTGGPLPPTPAPVPRTGGPLPPSTLPPVHTGGGLPPSQVPPVQTGGPGQVQSFAPVDVVQQMIDGMMKGQYGQDARRQGLELANQRGLLNSSIAAGASQRAALEGITPFVQQGMGLLGQREQEAFQGEQAQRDRDLREKMQSDSVFQQDWLNSRNFNRDFYAKIASLPIENAAQFSQMIAQYAAENPDVYTPDNIAGMTKFFNDNFRDIISSYLGDINFGGL